MDQKIMSFFVYSFSNFLRSLRTSADLISRRLPQWVTSSLATATFRQDLSCYASLETEKRHFWGNYRYKLQLVLQLHVI